MQLGRCALVGRRALTRCAALWLLATSAGPAAATTLAVAPGDQVAREALTLHGTTREVLRVTPPASFEAVVDAIPSGARLLTALALDESAPGRVPVDFRVGLESAGETTTVFARTIDPSDARDRRWIDVGRSLTPFAGRRATLRFEARPTRDGGSAPAFWVPPALVQCDGDAPSLLVVSISGLRADRVGSGLLPHLDAFAAGATRFTSAFAGAPTTTLAVAQMLTGSYFPWQRETPGLSDLLGDDERPSRAVIGQEPALTAWLRAERPGFQAVVHGELGARDATSAALRFLTAMGSCASTLYLHYPNTSTSRAVSPRRKRRFAARRAEGTIETMLPPTRRPIVDDYDARLALVDRQLGRLVRGVSRRGRLDQTLVIVTSDHGTELWDHGRLGATTLYDELLHVPLVIRFPTVGHRRSVEDLVSSVDLVPTIADVAGRSPSDGSDGGSLHQFDRENAPRPIFALATEADAAAAGAVGQAVRTHTAKLIRRLEDGALEFYDLTADPGERQSLAATAPAARSLIGVLDGIRARLAGTGYQLRLRSHAARPLSYVVSFFRRPRAVLIAVDRLTLEQDDRIVLDPDASGLTWRGILEPRGEDQLRFDVLDAAGAFDVHLAFDERTAPADTLRLGKDGVAARLPIELASPTLLGEPSVDVPPLESREATAAFWHVPAGSLADVGAEEPADEAVRERLRELGYID